MSYHPKPPAEKAVPIGECHETCTTLAADLGTMTQLELDEWRHNLLEQREQASREKDQPSWESLRREAACVTKWTALCEPDLSKCRKNCDEVKKEFQSGTAAPLQKQARNFIATEAIGVVDDVTRPRNEVVEAQRKLNCLIKYEECL